MDRQSLASSEAELYGERQRFRGSCGRRRVEQAGGDCSGMGLWLTGVVFDWCLTTDICRISRGVETRSDTARLPYRIWEIEAALFLQLKCP